MDLTEIPAGGQLPGGLAQNEIARAVTDATRKLYRSAGFQPPWISYLTVRDSIAVGTCAFKSPPLNSRVEIAYFTFPEHEGQGIATWMASRLTTLAREADPSVTVTAQTLPHENASTAILRKTGFQQTGTIEHPEDGPVWEWEFVD